MKFRTRLYARTRTAAKNRIVEEMIIAEDAK